MKCLQMHGCIDLDARHESSLHDVGISAIVFERNAVFLTLHLSTFENSSGGGSAVCVCLSCILEATHTMFTDARSV